MDLTYSDDQTLLRSVALDFLKAEVPRERVLEIDDSPQGYSPELWKQIVELGWAAMGIPEEYGGTGSRLVDLGVFYEAMGEFACPSPHLSVTLSAFLLLEAGSDEQKSRYIPGMAQQGDVFAFAETEPEYGWGPEHVRMRAVAQGDDYLLDGTKLFVPDAHIARQLLIAARTGGSEEGITLFVVDPRAAGVRVRRQQGWLSENMCEITLENVRVPASAVVGRPEQAWGAIERARDRATALLAAYMAGGARRVTEMAIEYSKTRIAFGVPIGTFQRVQDHVIVALNEADGMKWSAYEALWKLDENRPDAALAVSTAKAVASLGFSRACDASHMVHAGIGSDVTFGLTQYTKRARTLQHYLGDAIYHRKRMAGLLNLSRPAETVRPEGAATAG
jgi:alkylation response protein AidB-like acyl-CoA dehydrogenase